MKNLFSTVLVVSVLAHGLAAKNPVVISSSRDQQNVSVTVYNSNLGLIRDLRTVDLPAGDGEVRFMDVAAQIMSETVRARSLTKKSDFSVLEQNYEYDLISPDKLLDKYVGKKISLIDENPVNGEKRRVDALLLSTNNGAVYKIGNEIHLDHPGREILPELPDNLIAKPTLMWLVSCGKKGRHDLEVSYLTQGMNWRADYVLTLTDNDTKADIAAWVTVDNNSGTSYNDAKLKLVAGNINQVKNRELSPVYIADAVRPQAVRGGAREFEQRELFEYHIYDLARPSTIKDKQSKQIKLFGAPDVTVQKKYHTYGHSWQYVGRFAPADTRQAVTVLVELKNEKKNGLGRPFPAGIVRVYTADTDGSAQFIGEDRITHTPTDESLSITLGDAFDIVAERRQTTFNRISDTAFESEWEIIIRNHKKTAVIVSAVESLSGEWKVSNNSHPFSKIDAHRIGFDIPVDAGGQEKLTYRVRVKN